MVRNFLCTRCSVDLFELEFDPSDEVIFQCALDDLVQKVGRQQLVDIGAWEVICKRLIVFALAHISLCRVEQTHDNISNDSVTVPKDVRRKGAYGKSRVRGTAVGSSSS